MLSKNNHVLHVVFSTVLGQGNWGSCQWKTNRFGGYLFIGLIYLILGCQKKEASPLPLFTSLSEETTGLAFSNQVEATDSTNIIQYLYYYNGGGVAVGDINNDKLPDIYFSANEQPNRLYINMGFDDQGTQSFKDITDIAGVGGNVNWSTGVTLIDINHDGWLDIYACAVGGYKHFRGKNQLFINQGCATAEANHCLVTFIDEAEKYGLNHQGFSTQAAFLDYDLDGDQDMYLLCHSVHSSESYRDTFSTRIRNQLAGDRLYENRYDENNAGEKYFYDVSEKVGIKGGVAGYGLGIAIGDVDKNGYPDIYVSNDFHENDFLYLNNGDKTFTESSSKTFGHTSYFSMGNNLSDINNDGWLDLITLDMKPNVEEIYKSAQGPDSYEIYSFKRSFGYHHQFPQNALQLNQGCWPDGQIRFLEIATQLGIEATDWSWSALFVDFNLDGWKDLYITNGIPSRPNNLDYLKYIANQTIQANATDLQIAAEMPPGIVSNLAYAGNTQLSFENVTSAWGLSQPTISHGAAYADFDLDGDLDLVVNNFNAPASYFQNNASSEETTNFISLSFNGPQKNPFGLGVKVTIISEHARQYQELFPTQGWLSSSNYNLIFGLGQDQIIDSILVEWPLGKKQLLQSIKTNQIIEINVADAQEARQATAEGPGDALFELIEDTEAPFTHVENHFQDNNREGLIPYLLSTQGPKIATADVDGNGLEDFFVGGASGQEGAIYLQLLNGAFRKTLSSPFAGHRLCEDTGTAFFDADLDGDYDLYVGSGGNQYYQKDTLLRDRLYINQGSGLFRLDHAALPAIYNQTSCVKPFDFDDDGDMDLFVGSRSVAVFYGKSPDSYLLINDGKGKFSEADNSKIALERAGMITDAAWVDVDNDAQTDLVVVGDWMPVTIFFNKSGKFEQTIIPQTSGWYHCIAHTDLDLDGDQDLLLGNFGTNSNLHPTIQEPVNLYIADFDRNLTPDPILTYFKQGQEYPVMGLDAISTQIVSWKKQFRSYNEFATKTIGEILTPSQLSSAEKRSITELHSLMALNDGAGNFGIQNLPAPVQSTAIFSIATYDLNHDQIPDILLGGNFYEVQPTIGRQDASYGTILFSRKDDKYQVVDGAKINLRLEGAIRDIKIIEGPEHPTMIVARNNADLQYIKINLP